MSWRPVRLFPVGMESVKALVTIFNRVRRTRLGRGGFVAPILITLFGVFACAKGELVPDGTNGTGGTLHDAVFAPVRSGNMPIGQTRRRAVRKRLRGFPIVRKALT